MSIKSDRWIRRMAETHGMIEPFERGRVRVVEGQKIVSYGTELRLRRALRRRVQDLHQHQLDDRRPEELRHRLFVDFDGPVCIIPNSFALARTVEYFRSRAAC